MQQVTHDDLDDSLARAIYLLRKQGHDAIAKLQQRIVDGICPGMSQEKAVELASLSVVVIATMLANQEDKEDIETN